MPHTSCMIEERDLYIKCSMLVLLIAMNLGCKLEGMSFHMKSALRMSINGPAVLGLS